MKLRRLLVLIALAALAPGLAACGNKEEVTTFGHTEGSYLDAGNLTYQVQLSRQLNPVDNEDRAYLVDLPLDQRRLSPDETWFGVFVIAFNETGEEQPASHDFEIVDTQENVYHPVELGPDNVFAYRPGIIPPGSQIPDLNTAASNNPSVNGGLLLFRVKNATLDNRPIELKVRAAAGEPQEAAVDLDV